MLSPTRSRVGAALLAALVTSAPFLMMGAVLPAVALFKVTDEGLGGVFAYTAFGLFFWSTLFIPALAGIALIQAPLKRLGERRGWPYGAQLLVVTAGNAVVTLLAARLLFGPFGGVEAVLLLLAAMLGVAIWLFFDLRVCTADMRPDLAEDLFNG